ncbi:MAG: polysaccharide deacetylase family protein [Actinomycetota bacterium]|nr:polysaccharide deacetylase family protein [Actinomycetota bacterium]
MSASPPPERPRPWEGTGRRLAKHVAAACLHAALRCSARRAGVALLYHGIDERRGNPFQELVPGVRPALFAEHVGHLRRRYEVVTASELPAAVARRRRGRRFPVAVTFDDEHHNHRPVAASSLERAGLRGTFFLTGSAMSEPRRFWWERLQDAFDRGLLDEDLLARVPDRVAEAARTGSIRATGDAVTQVSPPERDEISRLLGEALGPDPPESGMRREDIRALAQAGHEIGFHTLRHDFLPNLEQRALEGVMVDGRDELGEVAGRRLTSLAYPSGGVDDRVAAAAKAAGFSTAYSTRQLPVRPGSDPWRLGRIAAPYDNLGQLALDIVRTLSRQHERKPRGRLAPS